MPNFKFKVEREVIGYPQRAMRDAVLGALFSPEIYQHTPQPLLLERLRGKWYTRLSQLRQKQWPAVASDMAWQYLRNCPPFGVATDQVARCCRHRFCPFCWARDVTSQLYDRVLAQCFKGQVSLPVKLVLFKHRCEWSRSVSPEGLIATIKSTRSRHTELNYAPRYLGAFITHSLEPFDKHYTLTRRTLVVMPEAAQLELPDAADIGAKIWAPEDHTRPTLVKLVAAATRYPDRLLSCPAADLIGYLEWTARVRMRSYLGNFRHGRIRDA